MNDILDSFGSDFAYPVNLPSYVEEYFEEQQDTRMDLFGGPVGRIRCLPLPGKVYSNYTLVLNLFFELQTSVAQLSGLKG